MSRSIVKDNIDICDVFPFLHWVQADPLVPESMAIRFEECLASQALSTIKDVGLTQTKIFPRDANGWIVFTADMTRAVGWSQFQNFRHWITYKCFEA